MELQYDVDGNPLIPSDLEQMLQPGHVVRVQWNYPANQQGETRHILALVDPDIGLGPYIVYKVWWPGKQRWHYEVLTWYSFWLVQHEGGSLQVVSAA